MVVKEDGTKWACQSCLKGHRVSACNHTDRELVLVPKKGRPVTQCEHCRLERKKRSAHVRCDCGESDKPHRPREKCIHLREAEERAKAGHHDDHYDAHLAAVMEEQGCCCHHGGKCSCAVKKETDEDATAPHGPAVKPRLEKTISEGAITVFANGHHKPVHRKNHAAHECGMPYKLPPRPYAEQNAAAAAARRSVDNLALDSNMPLETLAFNAQHAEPFNTDPRKSKSEEHSPKSAAFGPPCSGLGDPKLVSVDFSTLSQTMTNSSIQSATSSNYFSPMDSISGVNEGSFDPWSAFPSSDSAAMPNNNPFGVWPTMNDSTGMVQPALTAASSGTQSEIDEMPGMEDLYDFPMPSIQEDADNADGVNVASSNSTQANRRSLPPGFFGNLDFGMGGVSSEWQASVSNFDDSADRKTQDTPPPSFDDMGQNYNMLSTSIVTQRSLGGLSGNPRPQSRSVGSGSAPNDDLLKQLFPDIEINGSDFGQAGSPQLTLSTLRNMNRQQASNPTSAPLDFGPMDEIVGFTSQPWADGSISVPNDTYATSYDLDEDFSNPDFTANWTQ